MSFTENTQNAEYEQEHCGSDVTFVHFKKFQKFAHVTNCTDVCHSKHH